MFQRFAGFCEPEAKTNSLAVALAFEKLENWLQLKTEKHAQRSFSCIWCAEN